MKWIVKYYEEWNDYHKREVKFKTKEKAEEFAKHLHKVGIKKKDIIIQKDKGVD